MAEPQVPPDPIRSKSLSGPIAISTVLLIVSTAWAIYDEGVHKRPYIGYQKRWIEAFGSHLDKIEPGIKARETAVAAMPEVVAAGERVKQVLAEQTPRIQEVQNQLNAITPKLAAMDFQFRDRKGMTDMLRNRIESAHGDDEKNALRQELAEYRAETFSIEFQDGAKVEYTADSLVDEFLKLKELQGRLQAELGRLNAPLSAAEGARSALVTRLMRGESSATVAALKGELARFRKDIKQIHVPEMRDLVDRCESCHLGTRSPIPLTAEDMGGAREFMSHPNPELLAIHDPEKFGCSPCHWGNGVAVINVEKAHGHYHHWLWPMPPRENIEAGCVACHTADLVVDHAPVLNKGKEIFRSRGCWSCHRYEGFEAEADNLGAVQKGLRDLDAKAAPIQARREDLEKLRIELRDAGQGNESGVDDRLMTLGAEVVSSSVVIRDPEVRASALAGIAAKKFTQEQQGAVLEAINVEVTALGQMLTGIETGKASYTRAEHEALLEVKRVGPSLKEVRMKIRPEWLTGWIRDPSDFRPSTKMPTYAALKNDPKQLEAVAAFIWSRGVEGPLAKHEQGDARRGERLVRDRGCLGCHSATVGGEVIGTTFAAELTRVGEKANFDYLVRWVANPKQKTLPYSHGLKRDLKPEDFAKAGVPFAFEHPDPKWPKEWGTLLTHQMTVMPNLRLSEIDARDIATYLMAQKSDGAEYPDAAAVTTASAETIAYGEKLVKHYGCAMCHEIAGLEDEQKIGTELTFEGSKPIERLDFGHFTSEAKRSGHGADGWYTPKGFFDRKLKNPQIWDEGKELPNELAALKMPNFRLSDEDITAVSTFLIGSVESGIPEAFRHHPTDDRKAIQEGWWVVKKYNCVGCHAFSPGELPALWATPWFGAQGDSMAAWKDGNGEDHRGGIARRPPTLVGEGARVDPQWLTEFLRNPALSKTNVHRNGLRPYLNVRMPTYDLSENEIGKLVRFFNALSHQPLPYMRPEQTPLTDKELASARYILKAECAKCHATADTSSFSTDVNAPGFFHAPARLRPAWMTRLIRTPSEMLPGTSMPVWFHDENHRWVFNGQLPAGMEIEGDHVDLMVRFLAQWKDG